MTYLQSKSYVHSMACLRLLSLCVLWFSASIAVASATSLRVATIQFESKDGEYAANLRTASRLVVSAAGDGARLVLMPEFALIGYTLSEQMWKSAEVLDGRSARDLGVLARDNGVYIGTTILEVEGEDFYNTFILLSPTGEISGRVRKQVPAGAEGYFFRGHDGVHTIHTEFGNVGVGVCQENYRCFLPQQLYEEKANMVLMPFSYPDLSAAGGLGSPSGAHTGVWYARQLGVPVVTSNKTGSWPQIEGAYFPGQSTVISHTGQIQGEMDAKAGVLVADISMSDSARRPVYDCSGAFLTDLTLGNWLDRQITWFSIWLAELFDVNPDADIQERYLASEKRMEAARTYLQVTNPQ